MEQNIVITTEFIRLDHMMKLAGAVSTGGEAKRLIQGGEVLVNGQPCLQRGKKLHDGDCFDFHGSKCQLTIQK